MQQAPAKKLTPQTWQSVPGACHWGPMGDCGQTGWSCGSAGRHHCSVLIRRSEQVLSRCLVPTAVFLPPSCSVLPCDSQDRQMALLSGSWGLNSTCPHLGAEWECVAWGKSRCIGHFCLHNDLYRGLARALLGAWGFCGGGINPHRGRTGRRGTFNLLQLFCICHTPFKPRLGFYTQCTGFQW